MALLLLAACGASAEAPRATTPPPAAPQAPADAATDAAPDAPPPPPVATDEVWLKGSTHVHERASGDSSEPLSGVITWYEERHYDFIVVTDHNKVTEPQQGSSLIVIAGTELTFNPSGCLPEGDKSKKCRIHVNGLGVTERPAGKIEWANRHTHDRLEMYEAAIEETRRLGARVVQINHPQWYWGMTGDLLAELAHRGAALVEIANVQFPTWNAGDADHPSTEKIWDDALAKGATIWGVASDDAHDYEDAHGKWPPGGGWVVVKARRDPQAILASLAAGRFYSSTGVVLTRAEPESGELAVEVGPDERGSYVIEFVENGKLADRIVARSARRAIPRSGYLRAVVTRDDGAKAWVQPVRSESPAAGSDN
ncbi:MAG TPA: hypothetical protein VLT45_30975 [Kofleriaceae bacterium]|nr:hypothetical protein [Kofleriaceae bacterium]